MVEYIGVIEQFSFKDGLPDMRIESLCVDSSGILWIGTHAKGAVTYDGDRFVEVSDPRDLLRGVYSICEASDGAIWLGTEQGICKCRNGELEVIPGTEEYRFLWGSALDSQGDVWFGLDGDNLAPPRVCRCGQRGVEVIPLDCDDQGGKSINSVLADAEGNVWCGGDGLYCIKAGSGNVIPVACLAEMHITSLAETEGWSVVAATSDGLHRFREGSLVMVEDAGADVECLGKLREELWAAKRDGWLVELLSNGRTGRRIDFGVPLWRSVVTDLSGRVWVGTYGFGLLCYDDVRVQIADTETGLPPGRVFAVCGVGDVVWLGTSRGLVDAKSGALPDLLGNPEGLEDVAVTSLAVDLGGRTWIGKRNGVLHVAEGGAIRMCEAVPEFAGRSVDSLVVDTNSRVWAASTFSRALAYYDRPDAATTLLPEDSAEIPERVGAIASGADGKVYFGSGESHCTVTAAEFDGTEMRSLEDVPVAPVTALCVDSENRLWIGCNDGLVVRDRQYLISYGVEDGLPSELITTIFCDSKGWIWIGTEGGGLCVYDGRVFQKFSLERRPFCNTINDVYEDPSGTVWLATNGGVIRRCIRPATVTVEVCELLADAVYHRPEDVQIPDTVSRISFAVRGRSSGHRAEKMIYRFRLTGRDADWHQTPDRQIHFSRLDPGEYEFEVVAVDPDFNYSPSGCVRITVVSDPRIAALNRALRSEVAHGDFIGQSESMAGVLRQVMEVAWTDLTVLVLGETGTGKGLAARRIHEMSERREGPFIHVNCGSVQEGLVDSELFGHERGAFTGAVVRRLGKFELAQGGTIFLDEIGDLPIDSQARLLKVLQDRTFERVGGSQSIGVDVRVVAATNRDLGDAVRSGKYRADLYYRLNVFPVRMPALRERIDDLPSLAAYFAHAFASHLSRPTPEVSAEAMDVLMSYDWPGNVRELEHTMQRAVLLAKGGEITSLELGLPVKGRVAGSSGGGSEIVALEEFERRYIRRVLEHTGGVIHGERGAAKLLDVKPTTLRSRLEKLGLHVRKRRGVDRT